MSSLNLVNFNLRGPVRFVEAERPRGRFVEARHEEMEFTRAGRCIRQEGSSESGKRWRADFSFGSKGELLDPRLEIAFHEDGSRVETWHLAPGVRGWSVDGLPGVSFPTHGAAKPRTRFNREGAPVETTFLDEHAEDVARVLYRCGKSGQIDQAIQYVGLASPLVTNAERDVDVALQRGSSGLELPVGVEEMRATCSYDGEGRLMTLETTMLGQRVFGVKHEYNDEGDVMSSKIDGQQPVTYTYEYDSVKNWIHRETHHSWGVEVDVRRITYYQAE